MPCVYNCVTAAQDFGAAFAAGDIAALSSLLAADVALELPPAMTWYSGREAVVDLLLARLSPGRFRLVPIAANGQPAFAAYRPAGHWRLRAHSIIVLTTRGSAITRITVFQHPKLFEKFHLPAEFLPRP